MVLLAGLCPLTCSLAGGTSSNCTSASWCKSQPSYFFAMACIMVKPCQSTFMHNRQNVELVTDIDYCSTCTREAKFCVTRNTHSQQVVFFGSLLMKQWLMYRHLLLPRNPRKTVARKENCFTLIVPRRDCDGKTAS